MKAAGVRSFQYFLAEIIVLPEAMATPGGALRAAMYRAFVAADVVMRGAGKFFNREQKAECVNQFEDALHCYHALSKLRHTDGKKLYRWLPKHHALVHIFMDYGFINPRKVSCMQDEDMVGRAKRLYNGSHPAWAPLRTIQRYLIMVGLRWTSEIRRLRFREVERVWRA